jgi:hypothetical protein
VTGEASMTCCCGMLRGNKRIPINIVNEKTNCPYAFLTLKKYFEMGKTLWIP